MTTPKKPPTPVSATSTNTGYTDPAKTTAATASAATLATRTATLADAAQSQDDIIAALVSGEHFKDNSANLYDNLAYHWRFFMAGDEEVIDSDIKQTDTLTSFYQKLSTFDQVTIAESGASSYNIDEVSIDGIVGPDFQTGSTTFTTIEMKITEPNGVGFFDGLVSGATSLNISNYSKCVYYLELTFLGYNSDGTINVKPFDGVVPNGGHWIWTVCINDIQVNLTAGGGTYTVTMLPTTNTMLTGAYNIVPTALHPSGATVGAFFDDLCLQLNNVWQKVKGDPGIVVYNTKFHPVKDVMTADQVRAMAITPNQSDLNPVQGFDFQNNTNTAYIMPGFTISRVLDILMKSCEKAQKLAKDSKKDDDTVNDSVTTVNVNGYRQSILWRMEPSVSLPKYDPIYNEYYQHITLHIYGFRNHAAVLSPQDTTSDAATQKAILTDMAKRNFLPKKYEYLYTGLNSEVIDMDLAFNLNWQALLPTIISNTQEQVAPQTMANPNNTAQNSVPSQQRSTKISAKTLQQTNVVNSTAVASSLDLNTELVKAQEAVNSEPTTANKTALAAAQAKYDAAAAVTAATNQLTHEARAKADSARASAVVGPGNTSARSYAEELTVAGTAITKMPISIQVYNPPDGGDGMPGQYHNGKSIYGAVLNQAYGPATTQMMSVTMTIKGDPYWIGTGSFEEAINRYTNIYDGNGTVPNYSDGVVCFLFNMKYPLGQDDDGNTILTDNQSVTGVYQVNKVTHRFAEGKFTQVLSAYRVPVVDLYTSLYSNLYPAPTTGTTK